MTAKGCHTTIKSKKKTTSSGLLGKTPQGPDRPVTATGARQPASIGPRRAPVQPCLGELSGLFAVRQHRPDLPGT